MKHLLQTWQPQKTSKAKQMLTFSMGISKSFQYTNKLYVKKEKREWMNEYKIMNQSTE